VLVLPRGHALARTRSVAFEQVLDLELVGYSASSALHTYLSLQAAQLGKPMRVRANLGSFEAMCTLVEQGIGAAVVPAAVLRKDVGNRRLTVRPLSDAWAKRSLVLCAPMDLAESQPAGRLFEFLKTAVNVKLTGDLGKVRPKGADALGRPCRTKNLTAGS
jgi:DNA-binding transcriptional LysR family regulator